MPNFFTTYRFYPFFQECSTRETGMHKKRHLVLLAFGKGGVIIQDSAYVTGNGNFPIPKIYSDK